MLLPPKKYRISLLIEERCTRGHKRHQVLEELCETLRIKKDMLQKYRNVRQGDDLSLSGNQLQALAEYFGVSIDDLFTPVSHEEIAH